VIWPVMSESWNQREAAEASIARHRVVNKCVRNNEYDHNIWNLVSCHDGTQSQEKMCWRRLAAAYYSLEKKYGDIITTHSEPRNRKNIMRPAEPGTRNDCANEDLQKFIRQTDLAAAIEHRSRRENSSCVKPLPSNDFMKTQQTP
jgi:hypothetical protein